MITSFSFKGFIASIVTGIGLTLPNETTLSGIAFSVGFAFFAMMRRPERGRHELLLVITGAVAAATLLAMLWPWFQSHWGVDFPPVVAMAVAGYLQRHIWRKLDLSGAVVIDKIGSAAEHIVAAKKDKANG